MGNDKCYEMLSSMHGLGHCTNELTIAAYNSKLTQNKPTKSAFQQV